MKWILALIILALILQVIYEKRKTRKRNRQEFNEQQEQQVNEIDFKNCYQKKWMFTYNEKTAYNQLREIANNHGYEVFAKVRLFDLVEPIKNNPKYKTCLYKIQSKHVDFVLCDKKLVARYIIELDDNSHNNPDRQERDRFVDSVLKATGYKVLRIKSVNKAEIEEFIYNQIETSGN